MRKKLRKNGIIGLLLIVCLLFGAGCGGSEPGGQEASSSDQPVTQEQLAQAEKETAARLIRDLTEGGDPGPGREWSIIAVARSSLAKTPEAQALYAAYQENLRLQVKRGKGVLDAERPTDNARAAIALKMTGMDPSSVEGYDLLAQLEDKDAVREQGINAEIWALTAAAACARDLEAAGVYRADIRAMQGRDGGITYDGTRQDVDITAMAVQALALSGKEEDEDLIIAARGWLTGQQGADGSYGNAESTAQVILALNCLGEDPAAAEDFVRDGRTLADGLMVYRAGDGFRHQDEEEADGMATEQSQCALDALMMGSGERFYIP
ncbi:MAG: terpene cyclase/mutase family protein [Firmicutes bacterium]|nr:terpene cyclase/mutase family protein [Bacillota bacterium]